MSPFPLQLILFGQVDDFYLNLNPLRKSFLDCILIPDSTSSFQDLMERVYECRSAHTHPSLLCLYLADKQGLQAWEAYSTCLNFLKKRDRFPFLILITHDSFPPFNEVLLPNNETVYLIKRSEFEHNPNKLSELASSYIKMLSLINPDELSLPSSLEWISAFLKTSEPTRKSKYADSEALKNVLTGKVTVPCFNVKAPSMIEPLLIAAEQSNTPIILEVSPSEILRYYPAIGVGQCYGYKAIREQIFTGLKKFRTLVDQAIEKLKLSVPVFVHLDHSTSPEIILYCMDIGYDMVMYDGTHRAFNSNLRTTAFITREAHKRGILIEAEFSNVDRRIPRVTSKERIIEFCNYTKADLLGISAGQKHGSDYEFEKLLTHHIELAELSHSLTKGKGRLQLEAIETILKTDLDEKQRQYLEQLRFSVLFEGTFSSESDWLLHNSYPLATVALQVTKLVAENQNKLTQRFDELYQLTHQIACNVSQAEIKRNIDWTALDDIRREIDEKIDYPVGLVIHGGSSLDPRHLNKLRKNKIMKINFGSSIFRQFLSSLLEIARPFLTQLPKHFSALSSRDVHLLLDFDWNRPPMMYQLSPEKMFASYIDFLKRFYFDPLSKPEEPPIVEIEDVCEEGQPLLIELDSINQPKALSIVVLS